MATEVNVGTKRMLEYVFECLSQFNRGASEIKLQGISSNISKAVEVSQILSNYFDVKPGPATTRQLRMNDVNFSFLEIALSSDSQPGDKNDYTRGESKFVEFPVYHLLLDSLLARKRGVRVGKYDYDASIQGPRLTPLLVVNSSEGSFNCMVDKSLRHIIGVSKKEDKYFAILDDLTAAFYRCGLVLSRDWEKLAGKLSQFDDIILGVDTNILLDCALTAHLLDSFALVSPENYIHTPNWLLLVIPNAVMHEVEQQANSRDERGALIYWGRRGYRALEEILELDRSRDLAGLSLLIVGEANPTLDTRIELQGIREDFKKTVAPPVQRGLYQKSSTGDTIIRDQFKSFLRQIGFHKGIFFLTGDKSNAALAEAEGLHSIYYAPPSWHILLEGRISPPTLQYQPELITISVPFSKLIYELAVQFGVIQLSWEGGKIDIKCDDRGESLDPWINRDLIIRDRDLESLLQNYNAVGKFSLSYIDKEWKSLGEKLMGSDMT